MKRSVVPKAMVLVWALMWAAAILPVQARAAEEKDVSVWMPSFAQAPATVQLNVRVAPRKENRLLRVTLDSDAYYRSSDPTRGS